jgi:AcrR family transcriptional regulator
MINQQKIWLEELLKLNDEEIKITEKQSKILQAAIEAFSEKGFAATSTSEIAQKAGVAEGTIFRHYKTKKELLFSIVTPTVTKLMGPFIIKDFDKILNFPFDTYEDFLRALLDNRMEFSKKHWPILKIFIQELAFQPELQKQFKKYVIPKLLGRMKGIIEHFQDKGQIVGWPSETVIRLTASTILGFILGNLLFSIQLNQEEEEQQIEYTIQFLLHGLTRIKE